jgi:hypothetical protein
MSGLVAVKYEREPIMLWYHLLCVVAPLEAQTHASLEGKWYAPYPHLSALT